MSERWFGLDWSRELPWRIDDVEVRLARFADSLDTVNRLQQASGVRLSDGRFAADPMTAAKRRFYDEADLFVFDTADGEVGFVLGHPTDWSTYYLRWFGLSPSHRGRNFAVPFFARLESTLVEVGVERLETDTPPPNLPSVVQQTRLGFVVSGTLAHDRWGSMLRLTKHLAPTSDATFRRQFCVGSWPRARMSTNTSRAGKERAP